MSAAAAASGRVPHVWHATCVLTRPACVHRLRQKRLEQAAANDAAASGAPVALREDATALRRRRKRAALSRDLPQLRALKCHWSEAEEDDELDS